MAQMINRGAELIRINAAKKCLEYSTDGGRFWRNRYSFTSSVGERQRNSGDDVERSLLFDRRRPFLAPPLTG